MNENTIKKARLDRQLAFAKKHGWADADLFPLPSDASKRSYIRLVKPAGSCLLMDAPPESEKLAEFIKIAEHLQGIGVRTPQIITADIGAGLALIEDFGDDTFTRLLATGYSEEALYLEAVKILVQLHGAADRALQVNVPDYSMEIMLEEVGRFLLWFVPAARGDEATPKETRAFMEAWRAVLEHVASDQSSFVVRDFHVDNLMIVADAQASNDAFDSNDQNATIQCGLLDFQDALKGPPAYDMASLLEDARRDIAPATRATALDAYFGAHKHVDRASFLRDMNILAGQRHTKVAGLFVRLSVTDGKHGYLDHLSRVLALLKNALQAPELAEVNSVMEQIVPGFTAPAFADKLLQRLLP